ERACGGSLCGTFRNCLQFLDAFARGVEVALNGADCIIVSAESQETRDSEGHGEFKEFLLPQPSRVQVVQGRREPFLLLGVGGIDENHASYIASIRAGIEAHVESAHGVAYENVGRGDWSVL